MKIFINCAICKKEFVSYDVGRRKNTKCCSKICSNLLKKGQQKVQRIKKKCLNKICSNEFTVLPCNPKLYCNLSCAGKIWETLTEQEKLEKRKITFEKLVIKKEGCWDWSGATQRGYGSFLFDSKKSIRAHRFSWMIFKGLIPDKMHVLHKCDNKKCTNPEHLFLGSHRDNMLDMRKKGYHRQSSILNKEQVLEIKNLLNSTNLTLKEIAKKFSVNFVTIHDIKYNKTWKSIKEPQWQTE